MERQMVDLDDETTDVQTDETSQPAAEREGDALAADEPQESSE